MNSLVLVVAGLCIFALAYRFYGAFLAAKVLTLRDERATPAHRHRDGVDFHPTNRWVLFGHHFAAIAGAGPLIGPVLAAQYGFLPGALWILIGAVLAGGVHDFVILFASIRHEGLSLAHIVRSRIGRVSATATSIAILFIIIVALAGLASAVVNALAKNPTVPGDIGSPWGTFAILISVPAALLTGAYMYRIRPGKIGEASAIGVLIVVLGVVLGHPFQMSQYGHLLSLSPTTLKIVLPVYGFIASVLPVWLLLCPRDYLSSYMKIGVIGLLALGIFVVHPPLLMPAVTQYTHGGPVLPGPVWPFVCITIMCGAISGFHALVASGTTPKMLNKESDALPLGYGAMLVEGFVGLLAVVAACALIPNDYFAINANVAKFPYFAQLGMHSQTLIELTKQVGETNLVGRTGGAVTLAVGMAKIFSALPGMKNLMAYWYHFAIMFEALFILTTVDTGTRVARFILQEAVEGLRPKKAAPSKAGRWTLNIVCGVIVSVAWGYLLFNNDIATIWPMFGVANQLLAAIALAVGTTIILHSSKKKIYALVTLVPFLFIFVTTMTAGVQSAITFYHAPVNGMINSTLTVIMLLLTVIITVDAARSWIVNLRTPAAPEEEVESAEEMAVVQPEVVS
ncbi:MAG TPA: carbon starvation protein A [Armatimonadota bacterium]